MAQILVVEDEIALARGLGDCLRFHGHDPELVAEGQEGLERACAGAHQLLILDYMLPEVDGLTICRAAREARPEVGIIMLTARNSEADILAGFAAGADDYVCKPFSVAQLLARVEALLRRQQGPQPVATAFTCGPLHIDPASLRATGPAGEVDLSERDVAILALLQREGSRIVSRRQLLQEVWGFAQVEQVETRSVDMHLVKLRRKLADGGAPDLIATVRGVGYRLDVGR